MEEPGRLQSMGSIRVRYDWAPSLSLFTFHFNAFEKEMATHSSALAWRIPGTGEPGGLPSMGSHRVRHDWSDLAAAAAADVSTHLDLSSFAYSNYYLESVLKIKSPAALIFFPMLYFCALPLVSRFSPSSLTSEAWLLLDGSGQQHKCCAACILITSTPWSTHVIGQIGLRSNQFIFPVWHDSGATAIPLRGMERCPEAANWMVANTLLLFSH